MLHHAAGPARRLPDGRGFFPALISTPFSSGLHEAFGFAIVACLIAAGASWLRGGHYVHDVHSPPVAQAADGEMALAADGD